MTVDFSTGNPLSGAGLTVNGQGGADRLHDRLRFVRDDAEGGGWIVQRLAP